MKQGMGIAKILCVVMLLVGCAFRSAADYYWHDGEKLELQLIPDKWTISVPSSSSESLNIPEEIASVTGGIDDSNLYILICQGSDAMNAGDFINILEQYLPGVILTPCFMTPDNHEVASTPYINVRLKSLHDFYLLQEAAELYSLHIEGNSIMMPLWYILRITKKTPGNSGSGKKFC